MSLVGGNPLCERLTGNALSAQVNPCHCRNFRRRFFRRICTHMASCHSWEGAKCNAMKIALGFYYAEEVVSNVQNLKHRTF